MDSDSIIAGREMFISVCVPAPIMYRSVFGYSWTLRKANGIRRASPVNTNMLSFGRIVPHWIGVVALNTIPPMINRLNIKNDGVNRRYI